MQAIPKIIDSLRETLLTEARRMLLTDGGRALTIRSVAAACHVAVGTVYNYFRSKDELMAFVILEDWQQTLTGMREGTADAPDVLSGLRCVYDRLTAFEDLYRDAWRTYAASNDAIRQLHLRHGLLVGQLAEIIAALLTRHRSLWTEHLPVFLAETLLTAASRGGSAFDSVSPILERLIHP